MLESAMNQQEPERYHPRVGANFMVKVMVADRLVVAKARDLSMAGLYLLDGSGLVGEQVTVCVPLPGDREVMTTARVTRHERQGIALEFIDLDWEDLFALARFLHPRLP